MFHRHLKLSVALAIVSTLVIGCAVLTVDVDVYKGPLANTEEIQGEQVISLAMGAKPLLVQLRDHMEVGQPPPPRPVTKDQPYDPKHRLSLQQSLCNFRTSQFYKASYIIPGVADTEVTHRFNNELAVAVNDILELYESRVPDALAQASIRARNLTDLYRQSFAVLHPRDDTKGRLLWNKISSKMKPDKNNTEVSDLKGRYKEFFLHKVADPTSFKYRETSLFTNGIDGNIAFQQLLDSKAANDANILFSGDPPEKEQFISYVKNVAQSFFAGRTACHDMLVQALSSIPLAFDLTHFKTEDGLKLRTGASEVAAKLVKGKRLAEYLLTNAPSNSSSTSADVLPLLADQFKKQLKKAGDLDLEQLAHGPGIDIPDLTGFSSADQEKIKASRQTTVSAIRNLLAQDDGTISRLLINIDFRISEDGDKTHQFGLARGPIWPEPGPSMSEPISETLNSRYFTFASELLPRSLIDAAAASGGSLNRGRPTLGLESLIEQYLGRAVADRSPESWSTNYAFLELLDGLTEFGQKVVSLGNSAPLLQEADDLQVANYVSVLQSVGNSILVHVDELKAQAAHRKELRDKAPLFAKAVVDAGFTNADFKQWATTPSAESDAKTVADQLVSVLKLEYLKQMQLQAESASSTNRSALGAKNRGRLANSTNLTLLVTLDHNVSVTNVAIAGSSPKPKPKDEAPGTKAEVTIQVDSNGNVTNSAARVVPPKAEAPNGPAALQPQQEQTQSATNVVVKIMASGEGIITNVQVSLTENDTAPPPELVAGSTPSDQGSNIMRLTITISTNALITAITNDPFSKVSFLATNTSRGFSVLLSVDGGFEATNAQPVVQAAQPDKYLDVIKQATEIRSGMIYLRPAASYLRSSYPSSTLLGDQGLLWHNMLWDHFWRSSPGLGKLLYSTTEEKKLSEIDKQSWQNINRVRVAGAGTLNYVVAKDDIGNWYLKGLSTDATEIYTSMINLAAFGAGGSLAGPAVLDLKSAATATAAKSAAAPAQVLSSSLATTSVTNGGVLAIELALASANYFKATTNTYSQLTNSIQSLNQSVQEDWTNSVGSANKGSPLDAATTINKKEFSKVQDSLSTASKALFHNSTNQPTVLQFDTQIQNILQSVERYGAAVCSQIEQSATISDTTDKAKFKDSVSKAARKILDEFISQREQQISSYQSAINLIDSAASK